MAAPQTELSLVLIFDTINAYQRTAALKAAIELDLFTAVGEGGATAPQLAETCGADARGVRILCDYLVVAGLLKKESEHYRLTPDAAAFLDRRSPGYMGGAVEFLLSPMLTGGFNELAAAVRQGGTALSESGTIAPEHPVWVDFARSMAPLVAMPAPTLARLVADDTERELKVLDIAAGHGLFGIAFAKHNPRAEVVALDWPNVLEVAQENARRAGVSERYRTLPGSAFEVDYGEGYDLVLLTNFLHHFDVPTCEALLRKIHASLKEGGRVVTLEFVPDEDRVSPPHAAMFSLVMLATTPHGDAYTFAEFEGMFHNAGFARSEIHPLPPTVQHVVISHKADDR